MAEGFYAFWCSNEMARMETGLRIMGAPPLSSSPTSPSSTKATRQASELRVVTWNLLAPVYARGLEQDEWRSRLESQQSLLSSLHDVDVIALQEFWLNEEAVESWHNWARQRDYTLFILARTRDKQDGCATMVKNRLVVDGRESGGGGGGEDAFGLHYDDWGNRVALFVPLKDGVVSCNTHWTFAHNNSWDPVMRIHQARKISNFVRNTYGSSRRVFLAGDLNGGLDDPAIEQLALDWDIHQPEGSWVSHRAHTQTFLACDFVVTRNFDSVRDCVVHGDRQDLVMKDPPNFRVSDHNPVSATLRSSPPD